MTAESLFEILVFRLLKDTRDYAKVFDDASRNLRCDIHKCALKYYIDETDEETLRKFAAGPLSNRNELANPTIRDVAIIRAFMDRNYTFLITEFDQIDNFDINNKRSDSLTYEQKIEIAIRLRDHQFEECTYLMRYDCFAVITIADRIGLYNFAVTVLKSLLKQDFRIEPRDFICVSGIFIDKALKNGKWDDLWNFAKAVPYSVRRLLYVEDYVYNILYKVDQIISEPKTALEQLKKMRQNALKLIEFNNTFIKRDIPLPGNFDECFKKTTERPIQMYDF